MDLRLKVVLKNTWTECTRCLCMFPTQLRNIRGKVRNQPQCPKCRGRYKKHERKDILMA